MDLQERLGAEVERHVRPHAPAPVHADAERAPDGRLPAVASDQIAAADIRDLAAREVLDPRQDARTLLDEIAEAPAVPQVDRTSRAREVEQHGFERLLADLGFVEGRPGEFAVLRHRGGRPFDGLADRRRGDAVQFPARKPRRECDEVVDLGRKGARVDRIDDAPAAEILHRTRAQHRRLGMLGRARALLDQHARPAAPAEFAGQRQARGPAARDQHGRFDRRRRHGKLPGDGEAVLYYIADK